MLTIRSAAAGDAQAIGAVFDAAVREGWKYLGELAARPMFPPEEWDAEVAKHAPPNAMLVAVDDTGRVIGFAAVHPAEGEMFFCSCIPIMPALALAGHCLKPRTTSCDRPVVEKPFSTRTSRTSARLLSTRQRDIGATARYASPNFAAFTSASRGW